MTLCDYLLPSWLNPGRAEVRKSSLLPWLGPSVPAIYACNCQQIRVQRSCRTGPRGIPGPTPVGPRAPRARSYCHMIRYSNIIACAKPSASAPCSSVMEFGNEYVGSEDHSEDDFLSSSPDQYPAQYSMSHCGPSFGECHCSYSL